MRRDALLLAEIIGAVERILELAASGDPAEIEEKPDRRDSLLWNFTVLGEAANRVSTELKAQSAHLPWADAGRTRNASCTATGRSTSRCSPQSPGTISRRSWPVSGPSLTRWPMRTERLGTAGS